MKKELTAQQWPIKLSNIKQEKLIMLISLEFFRNKNKRWNISYITALNETNMFIINRMIVLRILYEHDTWEQKE